MFNGTFFAIVVCRDGRAKVLTCDVGRGIGHLVMPTVHLTRHLFAFFPQLERQEITVEASTVGEVVQALERLAPGIGFYICDERGRLRTHVNIFVGKQMIRDRKGLSDAVVADDDVHILQALSGG